MKVASIILAGGKGTRINSNKVNKVTLPFLGKPLIIYGVELLKELCNPIVVVVGAFSDSVKVVLKKHKVVYAIQQKRLGTAHATKIGMELFKASPPDLVLVGYGDHMMFYKKSTVQKLIDSISDHKAVLSLITVNHKNPDELAWGRVIRDANGYIVDDIEQKDASFEQRKIEELNAGFYCFDYDFLKKNISKIRKSPVSGEYYVNSLIQIAVEQGKKVVGINVPFEEVGIGINRMAEIQKSQDIYLHKAD